MTFEKALKRLAKKEPEKFQINGGGGFRGGKLDWKHPIEDDWFQDDIDEILALIGWEYWVQPHEKGWSYWARDLKYVEAEYAGTPREKNDSVNGFFQSAFPTKLEAAKAALIAVVEKEYGE